MKKVVFLIAALGVSDRAMAQATPNEGWGLDLGAGVLTSPTYEGDDSYRVSILPNIQLTYGDDFFASVQEGVGYRFINEDTLRAGPIGRLKFSRGEDGDQPFAVTGKDTTDLRGLGEVDATFELGGFVEYRAHWLRLSVEARQGLSDDTGLLGTASARYETRVGPARISVGPQLAWGDDDYMQTYFGITPTQAAASTLGYAPYAAAQGVKSYGVGLSIVSPISGPWGIAAIANVNRLTGDAEDSPIVADQGSATQFNAGVFLSYRF